MTKSQTYFPKLLLLTISLSTCAFWGEAAFSQTQAGGTPASSPSTVQEEPRAADDQGEVVERGILRRDHRVHPKVLPPSQTSPSPFGQPAPKLLVPGMTGPPTDALGQRPTTTASDNRYVGPTANLTAVANALKLRHKSLTTLVIIEPNVPVTQPVEISIGYYSPAGVYPPGFQRITQSYGRGTGNRFLNNDPEGDGKVRRMRLDISLREPNPAGQPFTFSLSWQVDLDPLYDVKISPLKFSLIDNCDIVGNSEIRFVWWAPDDPSEKPHTFNFTTRTGQLTTISQIAWAHAEVSAPNNLRQLYFYFWEKDDVHPSFGFQAPLHATLNNLVPGKTTVIKGNLTDMANSNKQDCRAYFEYPITYTLRSYPYL